MFGKTLLLCFILAMSASAALAAYLDFDGDGKTDYSVIRNPATMNDQIRWYVHNGTQVVHFDVRWGVLGDRPVPCDYDGDGRTDIAIWRPVSTGQPSGNAFFWIILSSTGQGVIEDFGQQGDDPTVVGDYDGDGFCDLAVYRRGAAIGDQSSWYYRGSLNNPNRVITSVPWGQNSSILFGFDLPVPGDFDGDGKNDFVIRRDFGNGVSQLWYLQSTAGVAVQLFGLTGDVVYPGDYDGDGKTDLALVRPNSSEGRYNWFIRRSTGGIEYASFGFFGGMGIDAITPGDYDGDGIFDLSIWRSTPPGTPARFWYQSTLTPGLGPTMNWGLQFDQPLADIFNGH
jgi:hypothetical protein